MTFPGIGETMRVSALVECFERSSDAARSISVSIATVVPRPLNATSCFRSELRLENSRYSLPIRMSEGFDDSTSARTGAEIPDASGVASVQISFDVQDELFAVDS